MYYSYIVFYLYIYVLPSNLQSDGHTCHPDELLVSQPRIRDRVMPEGWGGVQMRVFRELKHRTNQFSNCFSHAEADTVENWLKAFGFAWNQLI